MGLQLKHWRLVRLTCDASTLTCSLLAGFLGGCIFLDYDIPTYLGMLAQHNFIDLYNLTIPANV